MHIEIDKSIPTPKSGPDMWVALHYFTDDEKDERGDDEGYTYTVHATEEEALAALEARP